MTVALAGLAAGCVHVCLGPITWPGLRRYAVDGQAGAWRTGVRWGIGHSAGSPTSVFSR